MKKVNGIFLFVQIVAVFLVSWLFAIGLALLAYNDNVVITGLMNWLWLTMPLVAFFYVAGANGITGLIARRTMKKNAEAQQFGKCSTFINNDPFTLGSMIMIGEDTCRVAYVSYQNPFMFQVAQARELTDITSGYMPGPFNTTRYVYFQFYYRNKKIRIPTYTARRMHHISCLQEEISQADAFRDILINAQKESIKNLPFE